MESNTFYDIYLEELKNLPQGTPEEETALLKKLNLPEHMSANAMLQALNLLYTREELEQMLNESGIERD